MKQMKIATYTALFASFLAICILYDFSKNNFLDKTQYLSGTTQYATAAEITNNAVPMSSDISTTKEVLPKKVEQRPITPAVSAGEVANAAVTKNSTTKLSGVLAFATYYYEGDKSSYNSLKANYGSIKEMATQTFVIDKSGNLSGLVPKEQISFAKSRSIKTYAMITNNFDPKIVKPVLEDPKKRTLLISNILNKLKTYEYNGVSVDIEGIYSYNRQHLSSFMKELYAKLKPQGYTVTISVPAKTYDNIKNGWSGAYDYKELGKYADEVILMTYDQHFDTAGPIASVNWVKSVVHFALTKIPAEKIRFGVAAYGYDWSSKGRTALSIAGINKLAKQQGATIKWDTTSQSPYFSYIDKDGVRHTVWFENAKSLSYKLDIAKSKGLQGIAIWRIGLEDKEYWNMINSKLK